MEKIKLPSIKEDAEITITVGQSVYKEISTAYFTLMNQLSNDERQQFLDEIKAKEEDKPLELSNAKFQPISILVFLLAFLEKSAKDQGQVEDVEVNPEELKKQLEALNKD